MNRSEKFWDRAASTYDQEEKGNQQTLLKILEKTKKYLNMDSVVLDLGCGTGLVSNEIAGNVKIIHAIDTSANMIELAKNKAVKHNIENIEFFHTDVFDERFVTGSYDVILVFYVLYFFKDIQMVMQRTHDLLKPGGLMISAAPWMGSKTFKSVLLLLLGKIGLVPDLHFYKVSEFTALLANEKFEIIESVCLHESSQQYYLVARKNGEHS